MNLIKITPLFLGSLLFSPPNVREHRVENFNTVNTELLHDVFEMSHDLVKPNISPTAQQLQSGWNKVMRKQESCSRYTVDHNIKSEFFEKICSLAKELKANPLELSAILYQESCFDPQAHNRSFQGLIQMKESSFNDAVKTMIGYEKYCELHPDEKITLNKYKFNTKIKKPVVTDTYAYYKTLPREKQFKYAEYYIKYWLHSSGKYDYDKKAFKQVPAKQIWAAIHLPAKINDSNELVGRQNLINKVLNEFKRLSLEEYKMLIRL